MDELHRELARGVQPRATFGQRLGAYVIDVLLVNVVSYVFTAFARNAGTALVVGFAVVIGYFAFLEGSRSGQTLGKRLIGIRVVDFETGTDISYARALVRTIGRLVSGFVLFLGYFWMLWDRDSQTWHDKLASTTVVPVSSYPVERWPG